VSTAFAIQAELHRETAWEYPPWKYSHKHTSGLTFGGKPEAADTVKIIFYTIIRISTEELL